MEPFDSPAPSSVLTEEPVATEAALALPTALVPSASDLENEHPLFWAMIGAMQDGVVVLTADQEILVANLAFRQRFPNVGVVPPKDLIPVDDFWAQFNTSMAEGLAKMVVLHHQPSQQEGEHTYHVEIIPLTETQQTRAGQPLCVCIFNDFTSIRRTEKMRRDFVANVSHELRTPLTAIHGYAETLLDGALEAEPELSREFVEVMFRHSTRLSHLVSDLLDLSKLESPDFSLDLMPIALPPIVRGVMSMVEPAATAKGMAMRLDIASDLPVVLANDATLEQVLTNLLDNAIKYTPAGGNVTVTLKPAYKSPYVEVSVSDTGIGIKQKHIPRLFERFYRVEKSRSREMGGTGLGLSIVKHIVQSHGGNIWVESEQNVGTTFNFTLQVAQ